MSEWRFRDVPPRAPEPERLYSDRDAMAWLGVICGLAVLAGPRRTRPLAGFFYGWTLSRVHGKGRERVESELARLFDERKSVRADVAKLGEVVEALATVIAHDRMNICGGHTDYMTALGRVRAFGKKWA